MNIYSFVFKLLLRYLFVCLFRNIHYHNNALILKLVCLLIYLFIRNTLPFPLNVFKYIDI